MISPPTRAPTPDRARRPAVRWVGREILHMKHNVCAAWEPGYRDRELRRGWALRRRHLALLPASSAWRRRRPRRGRASRAPLSRRRQAPLDLLELVGPREAQDDSFDVVG